MLHPAIIVFALYVLLSPAVFMFVNGRRLRREDRERKLHTPF